jgi:beta-xylosidase
MAQIPATKPTTTPAVLRLPEMPLHDPWILANPADQTYYLYTSNQPQMTGVEDKGTMVYTSKDLKHWDRPQVVFTVPKDSWADPYQGPWAPEVHGHRGRYYLFTTLHNSHKPIAPKPESWMGTSMRSTVIAVSDTPLGPFEMIKKDSPTLPADFMTIDGTLYIDEENKPWMVYVHEWVQTFDGTMEAIRLKDDLSDADGQPIHLFKGSDAPWINQTTTPSTRPSTFVTDGPELFRTASGTLLMLWSSYENQSYVQTIARSTSGKLAGPWEQLPPLVKQDSGHGMLFHTFDGQLMMILHRPFKNARGFLYDMKDAGDHLEIVRERNDLRGE